MLTRPEGRTDAVDEGKRCSNGRRRSRLDHDGDRSRARLRELMTEEVAGADRLSARPAFPGHSRPDLLVERATETSRALARSRRCWDRR